MIIICTIYILCQFILFTGILIFFRSSPHESDKIKISIITAAKNEISVIEKFIYAVKSIRYPEINFELIIVDDNSTDDTFKTAAEFIKDESNFRIIKTESKTLSGKRGSLLKGIEQATFPFVAVTDADCIPSSGWLKSYSAMFEKKYDIVFGPSPFYQEKSIINNISCIENLKTQYLSFSLAVMGLPYTAGARNMGFSKKSFFRIGGYINTQDTLSGDDDLLLREAIRNKLRIKAFYDKNAFVYSSTKRTLKEYLNQKARHTQSSLHYLLRNKIILAVWHLLNLFMLLSLILAFINIHFIWLFTIKMITDIVVLLYTQRKFGYNFNLFEIFYLDIVYEIFIVINFFNAIFRKIEWK